MLTIVKRQNPVAGAAADEGVNQPAGVPSETLLSTERQLIHATEVKDVSRVKAAERIIRLNSKVGQVRPTIARNIPIQEIASVRPVLFQFQFSFPSPDTTTSLHSLSEAFELGLHGICADVNGRDRVAAARISRVVSLRPVPWFTKMTVTPGIARSARSLTVPEMPPVSTCA